MLFRMLTMSKRGAVIFFFEISLYLMLTVNSFGDEEECDKTKCPGPLRFYEDLRCKPIYKNPGDCCAEKYDCSHLKNRSPKKCYINDKVYEIGEHLKEEDALPCDVGCFCGEGNDGNAEFVCAIVDCFQRPRPGCSMVHYGNQCCPEELCSPAEDRAKCVVDGKTYFEGDEFEVKGEPGKKCTCLPGYKGENVEPFCYIPRKSSLCGTELRHSNEIREKCAPVYNSEQSPQTDCNVFYRCQNNNDTLIPNPDNEKCTDDAFATCKFGNIKMQIGDELNQGTHYTSVCVKCKCQVPPTPTCQRLPDEKCTDMTVI